MDLNYLQEFVICSQKLELLVRYKNKSSWLN